MRDGGQPFPNLSLSVFQLLRSITRFVDSWTLVIVAFCVRVARPFTACPKPLQVKRYRSERMNIEWHVEKPNACADDGKDSVDLLNGVLLGSMV